MTMSDWKARLRAASIHLGASVTLAAAAAWLVFGVWYPYPYREISGGRDLFTLLVSVDVILGPLVTLIIFNRSKPRKELVRDLMVVVLIQLAALAYGLWSVYSARPVHLVYELDRFRAVHAVDVPEELLAKAPGDLAVLPRGGPTLLAVRPFTSQQERMEATIAAVQGLQVGARPEFWQSYEAAQTRVLAAARPASQLKERFPAQAAEISTAMAATGLPMAELAYLPLVSRRTAWTVLLNARTAQIVGYLPLDPF